jgi:predicted Zn-dependent protease
MYHSTMSRSHRLLPGILALALISQPVYADDLPELGDVASNELSLATEKKIGQKIMDEIRWREASYLDDPDVENYLNQLGARLVAVGNDPGMGFQFFAIDDMSINAFAMPGGYIGVHVGCCWRLRPNQSLPAFSPTKYRTSPSATSRARVYQSKQLSMASMVAMGLSLLAARSSPQGTMAAISTTQAGAISAQLAFSRDFERESDRLGFEMLRRAGYDVRGMSTFFGRLQQSTRQYENNATAYLRTHPLSGERMSDMQNRERPVTYRQVADSPEFHLVRARVRALQGRPVDAVREFETSLRDRKYASEASTRYGLAVALARNRDWRAAEQELAAVRKLKVTSPMVDRQLAEVRMGRGDKDAGLALYREAMVRYPLNMPLLYGYGSALLAEKQFSAALGFADEQLQNHPQDARFLKLRADSYAGLGRRSQHHLALAELTALKGQTAGAIEQLQLAQQAGDANFYEMSIDRRASARDEEATDRGNEGTAELGVKSAIVLLGDPPWNLIAISM